MFAGCEAVLGAGSAGTLSVAGAAVCGAISGAIGAAVGYGISALQSGHFSWTGLGKATLIGAATGAAFGWLGAGAGKLGGKLLGKLGGKTLSKILGKTSRTTDDTATTIEDTTGTARPTDQPASTPDEGSKPGPSCRHSFAGTTQVLMADGTTKPIASIKLGDRVTSTNPTTGADTTQPVVALHHNHDTDQTDITIHTTDGHTSILHTTSHHPIWNATTHHWTTAAHLAPGTALHTWDAQPYAAHVTSIKTWTGLADRHDLTIPTTHTYYVVAGNVPVLVHNCGEATVHLDPVERHASITVRNGDEVLHTEQLGTTGKDAIPALRTEPHSPTTINVNIPLRNPGGAMAYQEVTLGRNLGLYNEVTRSCVTYCGNVLRAGGVGDIPETTLGITKWLIQRHG